MKKFTLERLLLTVLVALVAAVLVFSVVAVPHAQAAANKTANIALRVKLL